MEFVCGSFFFYYITDSEAYRKKYNSLNSKCSPYLANEYEHLEPNKEGTCVSFPSEDVKNKAAFNQVKVKTVL